MNSTFAIYLPASQGTEPAGGRISGNIGENNGTYFYRKSDNNPIVKRASVGGGSGPLIPRASGFNGGSRV